MTDELMQLANENEQLRAENAARGLTLATLCDMVLGESTDRSDEALIRAVGRLKRIEQAAHKIDVLLDGYESLLASIMSDEEKCAVEEFQAALEVCCDRRN